jgi:UDP-glucose 4-epimerase
MHQQPGTRNQEPRTKNQSPVTILVTGGCGFIGTNLVKYLLEQGGYNIRILDNLSVGRKEYLNQIINAVSSTASIKPTEAPELIIGDVRNRNQVEKAVTGVDAVIHLAAHTNVVDSLQDPAKDFEINVVGTFHLLEACRLHRIDRFIHASSNAVAGEQSPPINERKIPAPVSPYGASKLAGEAFCSAYHRSFGIRAIPLRFANAYGPYCDHKMSVVAEFIHRAQEGKPLIVYGDGTQTRDFIHASDICHAIDLALHYNPPNSTNPKNSTKPMDLVFQIATGVETRIIDLAEIIRKLAADSNRTLPGLIFKTRRKGEIQKNYSEITKAKELLKFQPKMVLEDGLRTVWNQ